MQSPTKEEILNFLRSTITEMRELFTFRKDGKDQLPENVERDIQLLEAAACHVIASGGARSTVPQTDSGWTSVKDSLPDDGTEVLVYDGCYWLAALSNPVIGQADWVTEDNIRLDYVTHWRHLPEPPDTQN